MKITHYGINKRSQSRKLENLLIERNSFNDSKLDQIMSSEKLGSSISALLFEKQNKKLLVLFDIDDGSGGTPADCKIVWSTYNEILMKYRPHDMIVLKAQVNRNPEFNQFYPFKSDVFPIGIFSNNPEKVFELSKTYSPVQQDIDVFFSGGYNHKRHMTPYCWPKNRDIKKHWSGASVRGYEKLKEIKEKRPDIKFALFDNNLEEKDFYTMIRRSKICIDLPGVGLSSRKFYEYMVFGKCVLSLKQQYTPWDCEENIQYCSMGEDFEFESMEEKIDFLLKNNQFLLSIENNVKSINEQLTLDYMVKRIEKIIEEKISSIIDQVIIL